MTRHSAPDSTQALVAGSQKLKLDPPTDMLRLTKKEQLAWEDYIQARTDWRAADLRVLHQVVKLESAWVKAKRESKRTPLTYTTDNGPKAHPVHAEARAAFSAWQSALRFLGLNQPKPNAMRAGARGAPVVTKRGKRGLLKTVS